MSAAVTALSLLALPFAAAGAALAVPRRLAGILALAVALTVVGLAVPWWSAVSETPLLLPFAWMPELGIDAGLRLDRLGLFFVLLIGGIGAAVAQYSRVYVAAGDARGFWPLLLAFMGAMLGLALADSLLLFFVFWELTTMASALLIAMSGGPEARRGAVRAFAITGAGGLCLLTGMILIAQQADAWTFSALAAKAGAITADPAHIPALLLMLVGVATKSAQAPFHVWLPGAMAAPAPVSAYLHSATMVKAGVLLLGRLFPIFSESPLWLPVLMAVGLTTFVVGAWNAWRSDDLKQLLAHSTVSNLGMLVAMYGIYARTGATAELVNIANHALYKSALFLLVGWLEKATGTRDFSLLDREHWIRAEPFGGALIGIGALAMAGVPLLFGFVAKEGFLIGVLGTPGPVAGLAVAAALLGAALTVGAAFKLFIGTFWGPEPPTLERGHPRKKRSVWLLAVPAVLLVPQLVGGVVPAWQVRQLAGPGAQWAGGPAFWHHFDLLLVAGLAVFAVGGALFLLRTRLARLPRLGSLIEPIDASAGVMIGLARRLGDAMQAGGTGHHAGLTLLAALAALAPGLALAVGAARSAPADVLWAQAGLAVLPAGLVIAGALAAAAVRERFTALVLAAVAGYGLALFYVLLRAPDLALTQVLVETVSLILLLLAFKRLPEPRPEPLAVGRLAIALAGGLALALLAWSAAVVTPADPAGAQQAALAEPVGHGRNAVNVILVDIRGADTLGEIAVLAVAALAAVALLAPWRGRGATPAKPEVEGGGSCDR